MRFFLRVVEGIGMHPLTREHKISSFKRFLGWELKSRVWGGGRYHHRLVGDLKMIVEHGMDGATMNLIYGLVEFEDMAFVLHCLRPQDLFVDIGSNVGVYSLLASGGAGAESLAFEPVPETFFVLQENIVLNKLSELVTPLNLGLGKEAGALRFTRHLDGINHVLAPGEATGQSLEVEVKSLDQALQNRDVNLIKLDVEGFELPVLQGAKESLNNPALKGLIIELNGSGERYGMDEKQIVKLLQEAGFAPFDYDPRSRALTARKEYCHGGLGAIRCADGTHNTLFLRDLAWVEERVTTAKPFRVLRQSF